MVSSAISEIPGIGPLTIYDTACRIGAYLAVEPSKIYLHAGTRSGASALGLDSDNSTLSITDLPKAFQCLKASEIEDCLCIYKEDLQRIVHS